MKHALKLIAALALVCALLAGCSTGRESASPTEDPEETEEYRHVDVARLPEALADYYAGKIDWYDLNETEPDEYSGIYLLDIDSDGHGVCVRHDPSSGGMGKHGELFCRTDDYGKTWYKAGCSEVSNGGFCHAWIDGTVIRIGNNSVTGGFMAQSLRAADMRVTASDAEDYDFVHYTDTALSLTPLFGLPETETDESQYDHGEYLVGQYVLPEILSTGEDTLTIGFRYVEQGCVDGFFGAARGLDENDRYVHFDGDYGRNTDLPFCFIGEFDAELNLLSEVYRDETILNALTELYASANASQNLNEEGE